MSLALPTIPSHSQTPSTSQQGVTGFFSKNIFGSRPVKVLVSGKDRLLSSAKSLIARITDLFVRFKNLISKLFSRKPSSLSSSNQSDNKSLQKTNTPPPITQKAPPPLQEETPHKNYFILKNLSPAVQEELLKILPGLEFAEKIKPNGLKEKSNAGKVVESNVLVVIAPEGQRDVVEQCKEIARIIFKGKGVTYFLILENKNVPETSEITDETIPHVGGIFKGQLEINKTKKNFKAKETCQLTISKETIGKIESIFVSNTTKA